MQVLFHRYEWNLTPPFFIGTDQDATDVYSQFIGSHPSEENDKIRLVIRLTRNGKKFIDLGANVGLFTLAAASAGARVLAVEALAKNYSLLMQSVVKNRFRRVTPVHSAVFDTTDTVYMSGDSAWARVTAKETSERVPSVTLDDLTRIFDFRDATLVKMDVEGAELSALNGAVEFLSQKRAPFFIFESNAHTCMLFGYSFVDVLRRFEAFGFDLYLLHANLIIPRRAGDFQEGVCMDYLAVKRGRKLRMGRSTIRDLSAEERAQMVVAQAQMSQVPHRAYVYAMREKMPTDVRDDPRVIRALRELDSDARPEFRDEVEALRAVV